MSDDNLLRSQLSRHNADMERSIRKIGDANAQRAGFAWTMYQALVQQLKEFESQLSAGEEVAALLANFGTNTNIVITGVGYRHPHLIVFRGETTDGQQVELAQHVSQVSLLFVKVAVKLPKAARRIGFLADLARDSEP